MSAAITEVDSLRLFELETIIKEGLKTFVEVGNALMEIRDSKMYRETHGTFEDYCKERWNISRPRAYQLISSAKTVYNLSPIGDILPTNIEQTRPLTKLEPEEQRQVWQEAVETAPNGEPPTAKHVASVIERRPPHISNNSGENEWYTPIEYINAALEVMGEINLDPASCTEANKVVCAETFYTQEDNGLDKDWFGNVWLNPPYAQPLIYQFCDRVASAFDNDEISQAIVLVNNATDTKWFHRLLDSASLLCLHLGRIKFWHPRGSSAPLQGQALLYFGDRRDAFKSILREFGKVVEV